MMLDANDALSSYFINNMTIEILLEPKIQNVNNEECFPYTHWQCTLYSISRD